MLKLCPRVPSTPDCRRQKIGRVASTSLARGHSPCSACPAACHPGHQRPQPQFTLQWNPIPMQIRSSGHHKHLFRSHSATCSVHSLLSLCLPRPAQSSCPRSVGQVMSPPRAWTVDPSSLGPHAAVWPGESYFTSLDPCKMNEKGRCLLGNTRHILWDGMMNTYTKAKNRVWQIVYTINVVLLIGVLTALLEVKAVFLFLSLDEETGAQRSPITCGRLHVLSGSRGRDLGHSLLPELQEMTRRLVLCPQSPSGLLKASGLAGPPAFFPPPRWTNAPGAPSRRLPKAPASRMPRCRASVGFRRRRRAGRRGLH